MAKGPFQNKILLGLLSAVTVMFFFSFLLVPLYNVFCEVTGLNGKIYGPSDFFKKQEEIKEREINIKFLSTVSGAAPIEFYPSVQNLSVVTDTVSATTYIAENKTNKKITVSIVPSVSPGLAADNVKKIQCFCLDGDIVLGPYEKQEWPLRFFIDSDLRKPTMHERLKLNNIIGLSNLLTDSKLELKNVNALNIDANDFTRRW